MPGQYVLNTGDNSNAGYADEAPELLLRYEQLDFASEQASVLDLFPAAPARVVDIGAGTGRDAAWFAEHGYTVVAVEPTRELRDGAIALHPSAHIEWLDDRLPDLPLLLKRHGTYDLVMLNAVWMHLDRTQRIRGMATLARLVHRGSRVVLKLRHGPVPKGRIMYEVTGEETIELAAKHGFDCLYCEASLSSQAANRIAGVTWTDLVLEKE